MENQSRILFSHLTRDTASLVSSNERSNEETKATGIFTFIKALFISTANGCSEPNDFKG